MKTRGQQIWSGSVRARQQAKVKVKYKSQESSELFFLDLLDFDFFFFCNFVFVFLLFFVAHVKASSLLYIQNKVPSPALLLFSFMVQNINREMFT